MKITFLGAVGTVTGSKYLVQQDNTKVLVDCGLFQGDKTTTQHNWDPFVIDPKTIDAIVVTHAHIDHTGYIPVLVKNGFRGPIYCSQATAETCVILLLDSGFLQEQSAKKHHLPEPLYTKDDAQYALTFFKAVDYDTVVTVKSLQITLVRSGHILGSAFVFISDGKQKLVFSGDLGRPEQPILKSPPYIKEADFLVLESTYGSRIHEKEDPETILSAVINETAQRGGVVVIPCFSVMRTQTILYYLYQLKQKKLIPEIPIYLDSPSAIGVTKLFCKFTDEYILTPTICKAALSVATYTPTAEESKKLARIHGSAIIIAGSGMADGGRVPHHLQQFISDAKNSILFGGYQAKSSRGRYLIEGADEIDLYDQTYPVRADIKMISSLSAHADWQEIIAWLEHFEKAPKKVFLTHGEPDAVQALKQKIEERFKWTVIVPKYAESFKLD